MVALLSLLFGESINLSEQFHGRLPSKRIPFRKSGGKFAKAPAITSKEDWGPCPNCGEEIYHPNDPDRICPACNKQISGPIAVGNKVKFIDSLGGITKGEIAAIDDENPKGQIATIVDDRGEDHFVAVSKLKRINEAIDLALADDDDNKMVSVACDTTNGDFTRLKGDEKGRVYCSACGQKLYDKNRGDMTNRMLKVRFLKTHKIGTLDHATLQEAKFRKLSVDVDVKKIKKEKIIHTLEGDVTGSVGDWEITGAEGEHWPIKDSIFRKTYEPIDDEAKEMLKENNGAVHGYILRIKNKAKKAYAQKYFDYVLNGRTGEEPNRGNLSYMAAQAVRINIGEMLKGQIDEARDWASQGFDVEIDCWNPGTDDGPDFAYVVMSDDKEAPDWKRNNFHCSKCSLDLDDPDFLKLHQLHGSMTLNEQQQGDDDKMVIKSDSFVSYVVQEGDNEKIDVFKTVELKDFDDAVGEYHVDVDGNGWDTYLMGSYDSIEEIVARQVDIPEHFLDQIRQKYDEILETGDAIYVGNEYGKWTVDTISRKKKLQ